MAAPVAPGRAVGVGAGVGPAAGRPTVRGALVRAIGDRRGDVDWGNDDRGWVVALLAPEREAFRGAALQEALAWCPVRLPGSTGEIGTAA